MDDFYDIMTDRQLAESAALCMLGPGFIWSHDGFMWYPPALTGYVVRGLTLDLANQVLAWAIGQSKRPVNYKQSTKTGQHLSFAQYGDNGIMLHPVPQCQMWHSVLTIGHVIAGGRIYECTSIDRARAEITAALRLSDGA